MYELIYNGLVTKGPRGEIVPDLATSWEILEGGRRYRFHLRPGVRFHDGRPLTATDVVWTFQSILEGDFPTPKRGAFRSVARVEALAPRVVDFVLREPYGPLLASLDSFVGIVPAGATPQRVRAHPIGSGPFQVAERRGDRLTLEAFGEYWGGAPRLDRVVLKTVPDATVRALELRKGSVHLVLNSLSPDAVLRFRTHPHLRVLEAPAASFSYLGLNLRRPVLADPRVRRALVLAIDRPLLIRSLYRGLGTPSETLLPVGHWARHETLDAIPYDPEEAQRLLDEAGYPDPDGEAPRFKLSYKTSTDETAVLQAQILQAMFARVGIETEIRSHEFATFFADISRGNFEVMSLRRFGVVDPDLYTLILHSKSFPPEGQNRGYYENPELDRLLEAAGRLFDPQERRPLYLKVQEIFARDLPYVILFLGVNVAVMPKALQGFRHYPNGQLLSLREVYWRRPAAAPDRHGSEGR